MTPETLLVRLAAASSSDSDIVGVLEQASSVTETERLAFGQRVEGIIEGTASRRVRNAAALALIDLGRAEAAGTLNDLLSRPDLAKCAGTLVFAMDELDALVSIDAVLNIIERGSYEARAEMLIVLSKGLLKPLAERELAAARQHLSDLAKSEDEDLVEAAALAHERLPSTGFARAS